MSTYAYLVKTQRKSDEDIIPGMISKDFALFGTMRSVYVNEEPDRNNPYLSKIIGAPAPKKGKAFDICSVSSDDSDEDAIIVINKDEPPTRNPAPRFSQDDLKLI